MAEKQKHVPDQRLRVAPLSGLGGPRVSAAAVTDEFRAAQFGSEQYNSGMVLTALARNWHEHWLKSSAMYGFQAVAFNMFLAFFAVLLTARAL
jgi:hypothetical protein